MFACSPRLEMAACGRGPGRFSCSDRRMTTAPEVIRNEDAARKTL